MKSLIENTNKNTEYQIYEANTCTHGKNPTVSLTLEAPWKILEQTTIHFCFSFFRGNNA